VVEADVVAGRGHRALHPAAADRQEVHHPAAGLDGDPVERVARPGGEQPELVVGQPDHRVGPSLLDRVVGGLVGEAQVAEDPPGAANVVPVPRRHCPEDPALGRVDVGLVDGAPHPHQVTELVHDLAHEGQEGVHGAGSGPAAPRGKPERAAEVVEGDHRGHALLAHLSQDVAVVADLAGVELALRGLDARPFDRQPVGVVAQFAEEREVLPVAVVVVVRDAGDIAVRDPARLALEGPPVAVGVVALDLVSRCRRRPQEPRRKSAAVVHLGDDKRPC